MLAAWSEQLELLAAVAADERCARPLLAARALTPGRNCARADRAHAATSTCDDGGATWCGCWPRIGACELLPDDRAPVSRRCGPRPSGTVEAAVHLGQPADEAQQESHRAGAEEAPRPRLSTLQCEVDESLIGGAVIRAGDLVIDGSCRGRLRATGKRPSRH
ncbi:MAG: F0F1 ATP synthase subunit delta [Halofilum sp. (in: g-proteobacteria)]|nr:F0F1 ATP synthase subunit delta [Halofilum sp. (in: g-proteobacteria)]